MAFDDDQRKCGGITAGGLFTVLLSVAMIVIGCLNLDFDAEDPIESGSCQAEVHIPVFLIGGGILFIVMLVLRFVMQRLFRRCGECKCGLEKCCATVNFACAFSCILIYDILAAIVYVAWLIIGTNWTFAIWDTVNTEGNVLGEALTPNFCPGYLYNFTWILIVVLWVLLVFALTCGLLAKFCNCFYDLLCCRPCRGGSGGSGGNQAV